MTIIKTFIARNRKNLIILSTIILLIVEIVNLIYITNVNVTSNDECLWVVPNKTQYGNIYFDKVKVKGVTWNAGIRNGYQLLAINGKKLESTFQAQSIINGISSGDFAKYTVKHGEHVFEARVYIKKLMNFGNLGFGLLGFFWLIVGFIVVIAKPEGYIQRLFYRVGACFVLYLSVVILSGNKFPMPAAITLDLVWSAAGCFLPFLVFHFYSMFPRPLKYMSRRWVKLTIYIVPAAMFALTVLFRFAFVYKPNQDNAFFYNPLSKSLNMALITSLITGIILLSINFFKMDKNERKSLVIILGANLFGLLSILYTLFIAPAITDTVFNSPEFYMPVIFVCIIPIGFGISIFKYQLMDVSAVIKNTIIYGAATVTLAALYFLSIYVIGEGVSRAIGTEYQGIIAGIIFILFAMVFQSTKDKFQEFITEKIYPEQFAYQKMLVKFSKDVSIMVGLENILDAMKATLVDSLKIKEFAIMIKSENDSYVMERCEGLLVNNLVIHKDELKSFIERKNKTAQEPIAEQNDFAELFPDDFQTLIDNNIYTIIPMIIKSKVVGLLLFGLKHSGSQFSGKDLELLSAAANQAAISIENARLYQSETEKFKIERDLDLARKIQQSLLPKCVPNMKGLDICGQMVPAMQVGGDYFDLIPYSDNKLYVVIGDVSGKGLSASLYMTKLQTMMQLACVGDRSPKEILIDINKKLYLSFEKDWFVTMTLALFDLDKKTAKVCRAGHVPLLLANNGTVFTHRTMGIGVGLEKGIIFEKTLVEEEIPLTPGKIFTFYSDGITEAMNEEQELFGEEKLTELLRHKTSFGSTELMDHIWNNIIEFRGKAEQNDDMTMVLVKVT